MNSSTSKLGLIGAGGHGKVAADTAVAAGWDEVAFFDLDFPARIHNGSWPILDKHPRNWSSFLFCSVGDNTIRGRLINELNTATLPVLSHPSAILSPSVKIGPGTLIVAGAIVNADSLIGKGVILNTACSVDHDCHIGDFAHISPGARLAGGVQVGAGSWIGIGAVVCEGVSIGAGTMIGAGAVVLSDVPDGAQVAGVPAKPI